MIKAITLTDKEKNVLNAQQVAETANKIVEILNNSDLSRSLAISMLNGFIADLMDNVITNDIVDEHILPPQNVQTFEPPVIPHENLMKESK